MDDATGVLSRTGDDTEVNPRAFDVGATGAAPPAGAIAGPRPASQLPAVPAAPKVANPADAKHSLIGKLFSGAVAALGGTGDDVTYQRDPATGEMKETRVPRTPGQWARGLIAGAFAGMAAGAQAPRGSGPLGAAGVGAKAELDRQSEEDKGKRSAADTDFQMRNAAATQKANMALLNQQVAEKTWSLGNQKVEAAFRGAERENEFATRIASDPNARDLGTYASFQDLVAAHKEDAPDLIKQSMAGNVLVHPSVGKDGQILGVHFAIVSPEWKNQKIQKDSPIPIFKPPAKPGSDPTLEMQTVPAGSMTNGEYETINMAHWNQYLTFQYRNEQMANQREIAAARADAATARLDAAGARQETARSDKSYQQNSSQLEKYGQPIDALAARLGRMQDTLRIGSPAADALIGPELLTVMAGGKDSGLRMTEAEIQRIVGGRSNWENLKAAANRWSLNPETANSITLSQREQIRKLVNSVDGKLKAKQQVLTQARQDLINTSDVTEHRRIVAGAKERMNQIDDGKAIIIEPKAGFSSKAWKAANPNATDEQVQAAKAAAQQAGHPVLD